MNGATRPCIAIIFTRQSRRKGKNREFLEAELRRRSFAKSTVESKL